MTQSTVNASKKGLGLSRLEAFLLASIIACVGAGGVYLINTASGSGAELQGFVWRAWLAP